MSFLRSASMATLVLVGFRPAPGPQFQHKLAATHMTLTPPPGWVETPVVANKWLTYDYALRYPGRRLEVRYAVELMAPLLADYELGKKDKEHLQVNPNTLFGQFYVGTMLAVRGIDYQTPEGDAAFRAELDKGLNEFPELAVKKEFGADWGAVTPLVPNAAFGQDYKHCVLVGLHKNNAADAYVYYLYDEQQDLVDLVMGDPQKLAFHSLRFQ